MPAAVVAALTLCLTPLPAAAQDPQADIIRGRVTDDSIRAVVGASITVTRGPDRATQETKTDSAGDYRVRFDTGTGDYLVAVSADGLRSARRRIQRQGTERELVADFTLSSNLAELEAVRINATRPVRANNNVSPTQLEAGSSERWADGVAGQVAPTVAGDLNALAGTMSNVTQTPGGISILGAGAESNLNTLNGMGMAAASVPRAARTETRVTGATFDPTRGGFAGANIDVRLGPGSRTYQRRNGFVTLDPQALQFADATALALGAKSGGFKASFGADGELIRRALTYNVAVEVAQSSSDPATLLDADVEALTRAGVSPDSVARLIALANPAGLSLSGSGIPGNRKRDALTWLGRLDDTRDTLKVRALTTYIGSVREGALGFGPLSAPSAAGERRERTIGGQITLGEYVGTGRRILTETRIAAGKVSTETTPYRALPGANVLVRSPGADGSNDVAALSVGGGPFFSTDDSRWTIEGANETIWNAGGRRHRFKALLWGRADGLEQAGAPNRMGTFTFNSLEDFAAGNPSSFSRTLAQPTRAGKVWNGAAALAHSYTKSQFFSVLYGARVEADGFFDSPAKNPPLEQALGVETGAAPGRVHISPRLGFTFRYNRDKDNGSGINQSQIGRFYRYNTGVIRGGIGEFRDLLRPDILAEASAATGLPGGTSNLSCVGSATPSADWAMFESNPAAIPTQCLDGSGPLGERAPRVTLIDPSYDVPRSWRASLDWSTNIFQKWLVKVGGLASYDLSQPGLVDANFSGVQRFALASEADRPVYVTQSAIDATSGSVSAAESRKADQFGSVTTRVSDLRGYGGQLTFGLSPDVFKMRSRFNFHVSANYTLQWMRRQYRGFDGASFGDPREREWAPNSSDARNVLVLTGGFSNPKVGTITLFGRAQSGLPFTPVVQGDVNGDGRGGDRAFIPDPAREPDAALASQIAALAANGPDGARDCLRENAGSVPGRNSCRGPGTQSLSIQWVPPIPRKWRRRVTPNVYLQNVLARSSYADPVLLLPRGFDPATNRFRYDVNPRFGSNRAGRSIGRDPFRVVIDFSVNLSVDFDVQELRRAVEPVRMDGRWQRRTADSIAAFYLSNTSSVHKLLLAESDSLFLSATQIAMLRSADSVYSERVRAVYGPIGELLAAGQGSAGKTELDSVLVAQKAYWKIFWEQPEIAAEAVSPAQRELIPMFQRMLETPMKDRENSRWQFGHPVRITDAPGAPPSSGGVNIRLQ
ncbi:MAG: carboxypeptidase-like regulatory domain-containing protein [Gemmatimonadaceae bacterium]